MTINWWVLAYKLIGGLSLFLFGMDVMTKALKASAGNRLKYFLNKMTSNRWKGLLAGTGITAIIQSSSVTTVLAVGFVSAGVIAFQDTLGIILGAGIGTTITAQIIAFKVTRAALMMVIIGYLFTLISKSKKYHELGNILIGLGLIFLGMNVMSEGMEPLKTYPPFINSMQNLSNPIYGILIGTIFTALVQSSSATTGVVIVLASQSLITSQGGISIIIGANIGTCITAFLSAIGKPKAAMQVAIAHISFKVIGALLWVWFIPQLASLTELITPNNLPRQIANAHTIFNIANATLLIGFTNPIGRLIMKMFPAESTIEKDKLLLLDKYFLQNTSLAIDLVDKELNNLSAKTSELLEKGLQIILSGSANDLEQLRLSDKTIDFQQKQILSYLQQIQQNQLNEIEAIRIKKQIEIANILEISADIITTDMVEAAMHRTEDNFSISDETLDRFNKTYSICVKSYINAYTSYLSNNKELALQVLNEKKLFKTSSQELQNYLTERLSVMDTHRIDIIRFETEIIELINRLFFQARRIAKVQTE